jgi:RNA polymerase sigma-70 factor (ECF subfamily)
MTPHSLLAPAKLGGQPILRAQTDERLVQLSQEGSRVAFEAIVARYRRQIVSYCARFLGQERAEDAVQQTFVKAYTALSAGERVRTLRPWLYRIAHNTSLNMLRDRGLHHEQLTEEIDGVERPDQAAERHQELTQLLRAVQALPDRQRDVIVLRAIEGRTYEQIADELGVSHGAVRQLLSRARSGIRAGVAAVTPLGFLGRIAAPFGDAPTAVFAGTAGGGGGLAAGKIMAAALAAAVAGGGVTALPEKKDRQAGAPSKAAVTAPSRTAEASATANLAPARSSATGNVSAQSRTDSNRSRSTRGEAPATVRRRTRGRDPSSAGRRRHAREPVDRPRREGGERFQGEPRRGPEDSRTPYAQPPPTSYPRDGTEDPGPLAMAPRQRTTQVSMTGTETQHLGTRDGAFRDGAR